MKTKLTELLEVNQHTCVPDVALLEVKKATYISKKRAREEDTPTPDIYREEFEKLFTKELDFVGKIPLYVSRKSTLCRSRHLQTGVGSEPASSIEIDIPLEMLTLEAGQSFLCFEEGEKILCFSTSKAKKTLATKTDFLSTRDGTFKSSSKQFTQIYTMHVDMGSNDDEIRIVPVLYALLSNKNMKTYRRLFTILTKNLGGWKPTTVSYSSSQNCFPRC
uniref:Uncharacterized protein LOC114330069 isoform X2 n=1 Tax=Diabrotica virgifera virgifera TaxID=50390 RepID=A0A6P7FQK6_DIAVI